VGRSSGEFDTGRQRESMTDYCAITHPSTIGDQLRNDGWLRPNMPTDGAGRQQHPPPRYPLAGDAGLDRDGDFDDYNPAAYQTQPQSTTSSSGPS
jgi:hypothetical protein